MGKAEVEKAEETNGQIDSNTKCNSNKQIVEKANERPEWLPDGWNVDIKTRKSGTHMGSGYKCYIDPVNGLKFYSKPEVLRYLETIKDNNSTSKKEKKCTNMHSPSNAVVEKSTEEDLPPGWIKEVKIRKNRNGIRKDPLFKDPVNGFVFRSKKDVLRYLESGDVGKCVFKPRRGQIQDEEKLTPLPAAKRQKLKKSASKQQFFAADEIFHKGTLELSDANSSRKGQDVKVPSEMMAAPVPTGESIVKMHSLEVGAANPPEIKKTSDPGSSALLKYESLKESEKGLSADDGQVKEHAVNMMENANEKNHHNHSISKNKEFNVRHRFSPRLAGIEPVQLANNVINEQTLQVPKRNLRKSRATLDADMENKSSQPFNGVQEIEQVHKMEQEVMNTSNNLSEGQTVFKEQPHLQETDKIEDKKPGIRTNSSKTRNKKAHNIPHRSSKRLAGFEHELNYISCENAPKYKSEKSEDKVNAELLQSGGKPVTEIADLAPINGESANKRRKSPKIPPFTDSQLEKLEDEEVVDEKSESQLSLAFHYSWSDPCLEFAINTLTGVLPPVEDSVDNGPTTVPETSIQKNLFDNVTGISRDSQNNLFDNVSRRSRDRNPQVHSNKSKRKKELKVPMRLSKRLAGLEPEVLPSERALEYSSRKCKEEPIPIATASDHLATVEKTKLNLHASDSLKTELLEESSNMTEKSYDAQTVPKEQLQNVEAENIGQERSEPQLPLPFGDSWSDPCFEFAIKTLTGALPVEAAVEILPVMTPDADMSNKDLHGSVVTSINAEGHDKSNQSQNKKELNMGTQPSELLMGQPMLRTSSTSCENAPKFTTGESCSHEGSIIRNLVGETVHIDAGNVTKLVHPSTNINTLMHEKPLKGNGQVVESEFVTIEQPPLETETIDHYNSEFPFCPSFMNSWSDPCLEFAFKTLTGDIPLEENFAIQGSLQESANCHERRDVGSTLTDVGSSSFSQSDVSFYYDIGLNSMPGQQSSMSTPILPLEKASLQGCPGVDPQKHYSQFNKDFRRR
ncbi:uncharacterized protein LOC133316060 [Gastrolobium bilobum]|uniref:uncharacterized protein LOC133316060 n=1 Tax=Gastrolobium bilobum TaxID=150636 RepID=UPI002AB2FECE|nr:uncharacterized protein LOC133316060 [Gastrolobium bilobum]